MEAIVQAVWQAVQGELVQAVATVIILGIGVLASMALAKIASVQEALREKVQSDLLDAQIQRAGEFAEKIVNRIEETTAKYIREAVKDGQVDRAELERLSREAYQELIEQIGEDGLQVLQEGISDMQAYLADLIEQKVREAKAITQLQAQLEVESPKA